MVFEKEELVKMVLDNGASDADGGDGVMLIEMMVLVMLMEVMVLVMLMDVVIEMVVEWEADGRGSANWYSLHYASVIIMTMAPW